MTLVEIKRKIASVHKGNLNLMEQANLLLSIKGELAVRAPSEKVSALLDDWAAAQGRFVVRAVKASGGFLY